MKDQFDEILSDRIKEVFENYEDGSASVGWDELKKRLPKEKKKRPALIWWSAAASLLLFLSIGYMMQNKEPMYLTGKALIKEPAGKDASGSEIAATAPTAERPGATAIKPIEDIDKNTRSSASPSSANYLANTATEGRHSGSSGAIAQPPASGQESPFISQSSSTEEKTLSITASELSSETQVQPVTFNSGDQVQMEKPLVAKLTLADLPEKKRESVKQKKSVTIGLYAGSYVNYAKGGKSGINSGLGLVSEIELTSKLKISTGLTLAQNSLEYDVEVPKHAASAFAEAALSSPSMAAGDNKGMLPVTYSLNKYNVSMLGVDMPVNLKYAFLQRRNTVFLSAGISSNFFVDQSYTYNYSVNNPLGAVAESKDEDVATRKQSLDIAKMLNLSVGFERPIWKRSTVSFEPFIKYPLGGMGTQDLRFGSAGLNLKLNLNGGKK